MRCAHAVGQGELPVPLLWCIAGETNSNDASLLHMRTHRNRAKLPVPGLTWNNVGPILVPGEEQLSTVAVDPGGSCHKERRDQDASTHPKWR